MPNKIVEQLRHVEQVVLNLVCANRGGHLLYDPDSCHSSVDGENMIKGEKDVSPLCPKSSEEELWN